MLDVYKRQVMDAAGAVTGIIYNEAGNVAEIRYPNAVSYTHLDVYKRQIL